MPSSRVAVSGVGIPGPPGTPGAPGAAGVVQSIVPGANVSVNNADPANPVVSATGGGGGGSDFATDTHAASAKASPVDADELPLVDSAASFGKKKWTVGNLKTLISGYIASASMTLTNKNLGSGNTFPTFNQDTTGLAGTATKLATARNIDGQAFDGSNAVTVIAPGTHAASSKTTPADADEIPIVDSASSNVLKKVTFANLATWVLSKVQDSLDDKQDVSTLLSTLLPLISGVTISKDYDDVGDTWPTLNSTLSASSDVAWLFGGSDESAPPPTTISGPAKWVRKVT